MRGSKVRKRAVDLSGLKGVMIAPESVNLEGANETSNRRLPSQSQAPQRSDGDPFDHGGLRYTALTVYRTRISAPEFQLPLPNLPERPSTLFYTCCSSRPTSITRGTYSEDDRVVNLAVNLAKILFRYLIYTSFSHVR